MLVIQRVFNPRLSMTWQAMSAKPNPSRQKL